jgi:putative NADH-flavin reductase
MRISIFGATGMAGSAIVTEALARRHIVTAWSRRLGNFPRDEKLTAGIIDLSTPDSLGRVLGAADAAVLAVRPAPGDEHQIAPWISGFLDAAATTRTRVLVIGGAASLRSPRDPHLLIADDPTYTHPEWATIAQASLDQFRVCEDHPYTGWTYLSPPAQFGPGPRTGRYQRGTTVMLTDVDGNARISAADLAIAAVDEIETPGHEQHFTVVQSDPHE